jgi:hypothetical protein
MRNKVFFEETCDTLAKELAHQADWNGRAITDVYLGALTDANFHGLRKKVAKLVNKELHTKLRLNG